MQHQSHTTPEQPAGVQSAAQMKVSTRASPDDDVLLTSAQARARIGGVSTMCIWRWMRDPAVQFPAPIKIGSSSRNYWRLGDLRRWQVERTRKAAA
jgi:predicted DNA-binding transcriptional regulator AlpA